MLKQCFAFSAGALALACLLSSLACAAKPAEGPLRDFLGKPRMEIQQLFDRERHPNVVVTLKGTVLATLGNKSLRARRSEDGGKTWGKEIIIAKPGWQGGGMTVDEVNGNVFAFAEDRHPPAPLSVYRSSDDGKTWRKVEVKIHPDTNGNVPSMHMNEHGITLRHGKHAGRLIRAARHYGKANYPRKHWPTHYTTAIYSDDHGKTWKTSKPFAEMGTGEAAIAELSDGTLYYNSRSHWNAKKPPMRRRCAWSADGGETWTGWKIVQILPDGPQDRPYGCFAGLVRLPIKGRDILLYSNCDSPARRNHGTVWASFDGGKTWPLKRLVQKGSFEYSSLAAGRPGTPSEGWIYMHFEGLVPKDSHVARFNLSWLMGGKPTGDGTIPKIKAGTDASKRSNDNEVYVFTSFRGNGEDGLHMAYSRDGLQWTALKGDKTFLKPKVGGKLMRDPCIIQGPDGLFHMVWTSSWRDKGIGVAHSKDLVNWTEQKFVPVMKHEATARNCWAPEINWDPDSKQYVIYWATTISKLAEGPKKLSGHRIYCTTTKDFKEYTKARLFLEPGFNVIDSTIIRDRAKYVMILKDERKSGKNLRVATSDKVTGPWSKASAPFSPKGLWVEGATCLKMGDLWYVYYDAYRKHRYGAMRTKDFKTWENVTDKLKVPKGMRHGTVLPVAGDILDKLLKQK